MSGGEARYTVDGVRKWKLTNAYTAAANLGSKADAIESLANDAARDYGSSHEYWEGRSGDAARQRSDKHKPDLVRTAMVAEGIAESSKTALDELQLRINKINEVVDEVNSSKYDLFYDQDGSVQSYKANSEWWPWELIDKEVTENRLGNALRTLLAEVQEVDQEHGEKIRSHLEELATAVKEGSVPMPTDPALQDILRRYQTKTSADGLEMWPGSTMTSIIRKFKPGFNPKMMTQEEIEMVGKLLLHPNPYTAGQRIGRFFAMAEEAKNEAIKRYGDGTKGGQDDGHGDAFRHAYWNALMTKEYGAEWTRQYATAHEGLNGNPANREAMDLYNNEVGQNIAAANPDASPEELAGLVADAVHNGETLVIAKDTNAIAWSDDVKKGDQSNRVGTAGIPLPAN